MTTPRLMKITATMLGLGLIALSLACIVPVYEDDGWGHHHRYHREWHDHDGDHDGDRHRP